MSPRHRHASSLVRTAALQSPRRQHLVSPSPAQPIARRQFLALSVLSGWVPWLTACGGKDDDRPSTTPVLQPHPQSLNEPVDLTVDAPPGKPATMLPPTAGQEAVATIPPLTQSTTPAFAKLAVVHAYTAAPNQKFFITVETDQLELGAWFPWGHQFRRLVFLQRYSPTWVPGNDEEPPPTCGGPPSRVVSDGGVLGFAAPFDGPAPSGDLSFWLAPGQSLWIGHANHPRGEAKLELISLTTDAATLRIKRLQTTEELTLHVGESVTDKYLPWQLLRIVPAEGDRPAFAELGPQETPSTNSPPRRAAPNSGADWPVAC